MSKKVYIITGAGLSAESGIPTFRSGDSAIWENYRLEDVCNFGNWKINYDLVHDFYNERRAALADVHPNAMHEAIAAWQKEFGAENVISITTNVDDLLERAGVQNTVHLHGKLTELFDTETEEVHEIGYTAYDKSCPEIKPAVIFFGEEAPEYKTMEKMIDEMTNEDVVIFIGMSFVVVPAMMCLPLDKTPKTVCVNPDYMSHYEHPFEVKIEKTATKAIEEINEIIKEQLK
ncbi:MAG: SIR2 family NAD-dependent protein deacylase [Aeromonas veronii]